MMEILSDERCGLFFLAGFDTRSEGTEAGVITVHAAEGALNHGHQYYIKNTFAAHHCDYRVRFRFHSNQDLHCPDSLESFARNFQHGQIVSDPTGAFARGSKLLGLARHIRTELGPSIDRIVWQSDTSTLIVVAAPFTSLAPVSMEFESLDRLRDVVNLLVSDGAPADLRNVIRSVRVSEKLPSGCYTPIDGGHFVPPAQPRTFSGMFARISSIAALIGIGTMSAASASVPAAVDEDRFLLPGITALVGLTTLGENSYGLRNHYQAVGGLRLYFGETGALLQPPSMPVPEHAEHTPLIDTSETDANSESGTRRSEPTWPKPSRVAYGTCC